MSVYCRRSQPQLRIATLKAACIRAGWVHYCRTPRNGRYLCGNRDADAIDTHPAFIYLTCSQVDVPKTLGCCSHSIYVHYHIIVVVVLRKNFSSSSTTYYYHSALLVLPVLYLHDVHVPITDTRPPSLTSRLQDTFRRLTNPTLKKLYRFVLKRLVGRFLDDDIALEVKYFFFFC